MKNLIAFWKKENRSTTLAKSLLLGALPILCCLISCAVQGKGISDVRLTNSEWNDELFYYKQVEGIVNYGFPQGYFGFNESHAAMLSFAAWSPVLVFPWVLWGFVFGWNLMSPILCNIVILTIAVFAFVWLARPTWRQTGILALLFCLFTPFVRYQLSGMPEVICFSMLIVFYGLAFGYVREERRWKLACLYGMGFVMTLMRPYLVLFLLLPACLLWRRRHWKSLLITLPVLAAALGIYAWIKKELGAEYFAPLFFTDWAEAFLTDGILGGIHATLSKLYYMGKSFAGMTLQGFRTGLAAGAFFGGYLVMMAILLYQSVADGVRCRRGSKDRTDEAAGKLIIEAHMAFSFIAMFFALLLMYKLTEGSKHLLTFLAAGIFVVAMMETRFYKKAVLLGAAFAYLYSYVAVEPYDYQVPFATQERESTQETWAEFFEGTLTLQEEDVPNFENVVIWVFSDTVDGESVNTDWQALYALPEGYGISCCMPAYIMENIGDLESQYLFVVEGGEVDRLCEEEGYQVVARNSGSVLYQRQ